MFRIENICFNIIIIKLSRNPNNLFRDDCIHCARLFVRQKPAEKCIPIHHRHRLRFGGKRYADNLCVFPRIHFGLYARTHTRVHARARMASHTFGMSKVWRVGVFFWACRTHSLTSSGARDLMAYAAPAAKPDWLRSLRARWRTIPGGHPGTPAGMRDV